MTVRRWPISWLVSTHICNAGLSLSVENVCSKSEEYLMLGKPKIPHPQTRIGTSHGGLRKFESEACKECPSREKWKLLDLGAVSWCVETNHCIPHGLFISDVILCCQHVHAYSLLISPTVILPLVTWKKNYYCPQTKFVILSGGGTCVACMFPPGHAHSLGTYTLWACTPLGMYAPRHAHPPGNAHHTLGTHSPSMHASRQILWDCG